MVLGVTVRWKDGHSERSGRVSVRLCDVDLCGWVGDRSFGIDFTDGCLVLNATGEMSGSEH